MRKQKNKKNPIDSMKSKIRESSYVIDFQGKDYDSNRVKSDVAKELNRYLEQIKISPKLDDWTLEFTLLYNNAKCIGIARKGKSVKSLKLKEVIIHIPIPKRELINWGVLENQFIGKIEFDARYIDELMVQFHEYTNREDYIIHSAKKAIKFALESGIVVNGNRIKMNKK